MVYVQEILGGMNACVVIPTYNESKAITGIVTQVSGMGFCVLVVDDGSTDNTAAIARGCGAEVLRNEKNCGKGASLIKGFNYSLQNNFDAVITMDGDGQHRPSDIAYFMRLAKYSSCGIFIGNRMSKTKSMPPLRFLTNKFMSWLISEIINQRIPDTQCGFRLLKREALEKIKLKTKKYETESEILIKAGRLGIKIESVPIEAIYSGEKSQINPVVDTLRFIRFLIRFFLDFYL